MILHFVISSLFYLVNGDFCSPSDYKYEYTECNSDGQRWRVAVPRPGRQCNDLPTPQEGINCSFSCPPGNYLDVETQKCRPCAAGRYSLGGGIRFEEFLRLPVGFSIENFASETDILSGGTEKSCPDESGWVLRDGELLYVPTPCISRLSFSVSLVRPGYMEFGYRMPKNNQGALSLQVEARNQQCQSYNDAFQSMFNKYSKNTNDQSAGGDWKRRRLDLRSGPNVISWTVTNRLNMNYQVIPEPIRVSHIDVIGLAFTRECTLCPAGTFSKEGSAECIACDAGYFSFKGSASCGVCPQSQYSGPKSERCIERPACRPSDFYAITEPCMNGTTRTVYNKVQPAVCRDDLIGSFAKPSPSERKTCPKCNPGMSKNANGICEFCPADHFSEGNECKRCPADTMPNYGYQFVQWESIPSQLSTRCEYINEEVISMCNVGDAWLATGTSISTAPSLQKGIALELIISVEEGFSAPFLSLRDAQPVRAAVAHLTVVFQTTCVDNSCVLYIFEDASTDPKQEMFSRILAIFNGTQPQRVWSHAIQKTRATRFLIAFVRSKAVIGQDSVLDVATITSINITNVGRVHGKQGGGATQCMSCPKGMKNAQCIPCPTGQFLHPKTQLCTSCPIDSIVNVAYKEGEEFCVPCGTNLKSKDGRSCTSYDGVVSVETDNRTVSYDFSPWLNKTWNVNGVHVFAREGISYYHSFNLTLFNQHTVKCAVAFKNINPVYDQVNEEVEGVGCRLTVLPETNANKTSLAFVSPFLLATRLEEISTKRVRDGWNLTDQMLEYDEGNNGSRPLDIHFWFDTIGVPTEVSPKGTVLVVTARCSNTHQTPQARLPRSCPDGTCDGSLFHVIIESVQACPICKQGNYKQIRGECVAGKQTIHFIPEKHCVLSGKEAQSHEEPCSVLTKGQKFFMVTAVILLLALSLALASICRRNKRLEYKYTRLIESRTGELPAAESCGIEEDEDEEEEDRVTFSKGKRKLFGSNRLGNGSRVEADSKAFVRLENEDE